MTPTADGGIRFTGPVERPSGTVDFSTEARIEAEDGAVGLQPTELEADQPLRGLEELLVVQRFTVRVPLEPLPFGQRITDVRIEPEGLAVRASGSGVDLGS